MIKVLYGVVKSGNVCDDGGIFENEGGGIRRPFELT